MCFALSYTSLVIAAPNTTSLGLTSVLESSQYRSVFNHVHFHPSETNNLAVVYYG